MIAMIIITLAIISFGIFVSIARYRECKDFGHTTFYCVTAK